MATACHFRYYKTWEGGGISINKTMWPNAKVITATGFTCKCASVPFLFVCLFIILCIGRMWRPFIIFFFLHIMPLGTGWGCGPYGGFPLSGASELLFSGCRL